MSSGYSKGLNVQNVTSVLHAIFELPYSQKLSGFCNNPDLDEAKRITSVATASVVIFNLAVLRKDLIRSHNICRFFIAEFETEFWWR